MPTATVAVCVLIGLLFTGIAAQPDYCLLRPETGPCRANIQKYYFHAGNHTCKQFTYGGCEGNGNRFDSTEDCLNNCSYPEATNKLCQSAGFKNLKNGFVKAIYLGYETEESLCKSFIRRTCNLPPGTGTCLGNYSKFYYNASTEACEEFTDGECGGNDNRFETIQECQQTCNDTAAPKEYVDPCTLPVVTGPCEAKFPRFFFNSTSGQCEDFIYGGCQGNGNRFETRQRCENKCGSPPATPTTIDICLQTPETGTCLTLFVRFYFNASSEMCEEYGTCQAYGNGFDSQQFCERVCATSTRTPSDTCWQPAKTGPCKARLPRFFYNSTSEKCEGFIYGGCHGNDNRFETTEDCENICNRTSTPQPPIDVCLLPPETGPCFAFFRKFYFNASSEMCEEFIYGGCQGNDNRFEKEQDCQTACIGTSTPQPPIDVCLLPPETGPCEAIMPMFFYNSTSEKCEGFIYGGCEGNDNRFEKEQDCQTACNGTSTAQPPIDVCLLPPETGPCEAYMPMFFYNSTSEKCEGFIYGGCKGNDNRFEKEQDCLTACNRTSTPKPPIDLCLLPPETGPCKAYMPMFFYNSTSEKCEGFIYGGCKGNDNRFEKEQDCLTACNRTSTPKPPIDLCLLPPETGPCKAYMPMFFYNSTSEKCEDFIYGGCKGNDNRFEKEQDCLTSCNRTSTPKPPIDLCLLPPETGPCKAYMPMFFYNSTSEKCEGFIYGGCRGNDNRFEAQKDCYSKCENPLPGNACNLPPDTGPCDGNFQAYFYNKTAHACELFTYGGCEGNNNRFDSKLACQQTCRCSAL